MGWRAAPCLRGSAPPARSRPRTRTPRLAASRQACDKGPTPAVCHLACAYCHSTAAVGHLSAVICSAGSALDCSEPFTRFRKAPSARRIRRSGARAVQICWFHPPSKCVSSAGPSLSEWEALYARAWAESNTRGGHTRKAVERGGRASHRTSPRSARWMTGG
jgi:hypothetical protein